MCGVAPVPTHNQRLLEVVMIKINKNETCLKDQQYIINAPKLKRTMHLRCVYYKFKIEMYNEYTK